MTDNTRIGLVIGQDAKALSVEELRGHYHARFLDYCKVPAHVLADTLNGSVWSDMNSLLGYIKRFEREHYPMDLVYLYEGQRRFHVVEVTLNNEGQEYTVTATVDGTISGKHVLDSAYTKALMHSLDNVLTNKEGNSISIDNERVFERMVTKIEIVKAEPA